MTLVSTKVRVGHLPNSYDLSGAYIDGLRIGAVEKIVMDEPDPDLLGPYIRAAQMDSFLIKVQKDYSEGREVAEC